MSVATSTRRAFKRASVRLFMGADKLGLHILPKHYYSAIPDYAWLKRNKSVWCRRVDMTGVDWNLPEQLQWLRQHCSPYYSEVRGLLNYQAAIARNFGPGYGPIESQVLHCILRSSKPRRIIEVGCGVSTTCMLHALRRNELEGQPPCEVTCIEPFPAAALSTLPGIQLKQALVQSLPLTVFDQLEAGDILFIDSTHSLKTGSDVQYLYLEVLPRLRPGVIIHIHDVFLPFLYPPNVLEQYFDWQETALLLAMLKGNSNLSVLSCLSALHCDFAEALENILTDYRPQQNNEAGLGLSKFGHFPSSIWLQTKTDPAIQ